MSERIPGDIIKGTPGGNTNGIPRRMPERFPGKHEKGTPFQEGRKELPSRNEFLKEFLVESQMEHLDETHKQFFDDSLDELLDDS